MGNRPVLRPTLYIFAKAPVPGTVKTRLARTIGADAACAVYQELLTNTIKELAAASAWRTVLAVSPDETAGRDGIWPHALSRVPQGAGDLGDRMYRVLALARRDGPVAIVGSDIPDLKCDQVAAAFSALRHSDLVVGPAVDGGYWLIGAATPPPRQLFANVRWSTSSALEDTLANTGDLRVEWLGTRLEDVDDAESYRRYRDRHNHQR